MERNNSISIKKEDPFFKNITILRIEKDNNDIINQQFNNAGESSTKTLYI